MADGALAKAELRQLDADFHEEIEEDTWTKVQFNPDTLKVTFANQVATPSGSGDQRGTPARQFVGAGTTKLAVQLWFDVSSPQEGQVEDDVRKLTQKVAYFITPKAVDDKFVPPAVRFLWGSFQFDGIMESMEESMDFFSPEGKPLRASVSFSLSQQKITAFAFGQSRTAPSGRRGALAAGTAPMTAAPQNGTVQGLAAGQGKQGNWQAIAASNGIENPRLLQPGQLLDLGARARRPAEGG
jgi:hypothetical protein